METRDDTQIEDSSLSKDDMQLLMYLRTRLLGSETRFIRNQRLVTFQKQLKLIENYSTRGDINDWKRCRVCGLCWLDFETVAVDVRRLSWVLGRAKSSINTNFVMIGYETVKASTEGWDLLKMKLRISQSERKEMRSWTIRKLIQQKDSVFVDDEWEAEMELNWDLQESSP
jgi:hypothetical protein